jgi:hypothetical protein
MIMKRSETCLMLVVTGSLLLAAVPVGCAPETAQSTGSPQEVTAPGTESPTVQAAEQSPEELDQLVAPIALYPDALIAQILAASADPTEIVEADRWLKQHSGL